MKRITALILSLILLLASTALADSVDGQHTWEFYPVENGYTDDFDGDTTPESLEFSTRTNEYGDGSFTITTGNTSYTVDNCMMLSGEIYAAKLGWNRLENEIYYATLFLVSEYGPSDDPVSYCFLYENGTFYQIGMIPALPETMVFNNDGLISTSIRASKIGTWDRPADYVLSSGFHYAYDEPDGELIYWRGIAEVPRDIYPMGMIVTLNMDLPLKTSRYDSGASLLLEGGQQVILAASDDAGWLYVTSMDQTLGGWIEMRGEDVQEFTINGKTYTETEVFSDILYAD